MFILSRLGRLDQDLKHITSNNSIGIENSW